MEHRVDYRSNNFPKVKEDQFAWSSFLFPIKVLLDIIK